MIPTAGIKLSKISLRKCQEQLHFIVPLQNDVFCCSSQLAIEFHGTCVGYRLQSIVHKRFQFIRIISTSVTKVQRWPKLVMVFTIALFGFDEIRNVCIFIEQSLVYFFQKELLVFSQIESCKLTFSYMNKIRPPLASSSTECGAHNSLRVML